jgi:hypothetical protein
MRIAIGRRSRGCRMHVGFVAHTARPLFKCLFLVGGTREAQSASFRRMVALGIQRRENYHHQQQQQCNRGSLSR